MSAKKDAKKIRPEMYDVIVNPIVTEKSQIDSQYNKVSFVVSVDSNKSQVKQAVEAIFNVKVDKVNIINNKGKVKRFRGTLGKRKDTKKAIVTLAEGSNIDVAA